VEGNDDDPSLSEFFSRIIAESLTEVGEQLAGP
jgi:hypothetical protein